MYEAELQELRACLVTVREDPESIPAVTDQLFGHSVRPAAVAIHLTRECDQGVPNGLTEHWDKLNADTQTALRNSLYGRMVVLREQARRVHTQSNEQIDETIDGLVLILEGLPTKIGMTLETAILSGALQARSVELIQKLDMLRCEWPEMMEYELDAALCQ